MDASLIRIVCAVLAVVFIGVIVLRRKKAWSNANAAAGNSSGRAACRRNDSRRANRRVRN